MKMSFQKSTCGTAISCLLISAVISIPAIASDTEESGESQNAEVENREKILSAALERLAAKRRNRAEAELRAQESMKADLEASRERMAKVILSNMIPVPGLSIKMGRTEVTQSQWEGIMGNNGSQFPYPNHPVECVSWDEVNEFIKILNSLPEIIQSGLTFRLPTPEEWQYACLAGGTGDFGLLENGKEGTSKEMARYISNTNNGSSPQDVGTLKPNAWGFYDMHGNVAEWTSSMWGDDVVVCGGNYSCWDYDCTAKSMTRKSRESKFPTTGFRLCAN